MRARTVTSDSNSGDDSGGYIEFATKPEAGTIAERMRITSGGFVGIDRSSNIHEKLHVNGMICSTASSATSSTAGNQRAIMDLTSNAARIGHFRGTNGAGSGSVQFFVDSVEKMRLLTGGGITFNGDTAAANALDDYEEGTITPSMSGASSHPTNTFQSRGGKYTKIGDRCYWSIRVEMNGSGITPGSGTLSVDGLPFVVLSDDNNQGGISVGHTANWLTGQHGAPTGGFYNTNTQAFFLVVYDNDAGNISGMSYADAADVDDSTTFTASGHYKVA